MAKTGNKATRKLAKKGLLDFTSRVGSKKGKGGGKMGKGGATKLVRDGSVATGHPKGGKRGGSKPVQKSGDMKRPGADKGGVDEEDDEEALAQQEERNEIEEMDVDDFMKRGMFGGEDEGDSSEEEEDAEEEGKGGLEEEDDDDDDEEEMDQDGADEDEEEEEEANKEEELLEDEVKQHKAELERLKAKDPDFFKFLEKNDGNLLSFGQDEEEDEEEKDNEGGDDDDGEGEGEDEEEEDPTTPTTIEEEGAKELTLALLKTIEHAALEQHSLKGLRKLVLAFKAASHMADESSRHGPSQQAYTIASSSVFDRLLVTCLTSLPEAFGHHLFQNPDYSASDPAPFAKLGSIPAFRSLRPMVYRSLKALHYLLGQVTEASLLSFLLSRLERFLPFLIPFPRLAKFYLKTLLSLWATSEALDVKLSSFLRIRQAATVLPFPFLEDCLKGIYLSYARNAKFVTESSLPGLTLMGNCLVELYGLDMTSAYQHAFVYLRQLALHLRAAYTKKTPEALQKVYCWQFLNCCKVWVAVLTAYPSLTPSSSSSSSSEQQQQELRELVFPLAQILIGTIKLAPSARHYPLALHALTLLQRLAARAHVFVPCASFCLDMLENPALKKSKPTTDPPPSLLLSLKLTGKSGIEFKNVQEALVTECMDVLTQEILIYRYTIALPEYVFPIKERLKRWAKKNTRQNARWRALARGVVDECEKWGKWVEKERMRRELAPTDKASFEALFPPGGGREGGEMDAGGRLKAFLDAKALREGLGGEDAMLVQQQQQQRQQQQQQQQQKQKGGKKVRPASAEDEQYEDEAEKKAGKKGANKKLEKQQQQQQQQQKSVPVERMEDEVGDLGAWSDDDDDDEEEEEEEEGEEDREEQSEDDSE